MAIAFTFPGQGSQSVGMGKALADAFPAARSVFTEVDDALSQKLSTLMWEGPEADLTLTENAQPALMAVSLAVMRVLETEHGVKLEDAAQFVAGHSLGEYSALAAAGTFSIADAARLLKVRGKAMQVEAILPNGTNQIVSYVGNFNFNWMTNYIYDDDAAPVFPKGTIIHVSAWYDNTKANKFNPDPDQWVGYGDRTVDEMAHAWMNVVYLDDNEYKALLAERAAKTSQSASARR